MSLALSTDLGKATLGATNIMTMAEVSLFTVIPCKLFPQNEDLWDDTVVEKVEQITSSEKWVEALGPAILYLLLTPFAFIFIAMYGLSFFMYNGGTAPNSFLLFLYFVPPLFLISSVILFATYFGEQTSRKKMLQHIAHYAPWVGLLGLVLFGLISNFFTGH